MNLTEEVALDVALSDVTRLMDARKMMPLRREDVRGAINIVAEAIQYGYVSIAEDCSITQKLLEPIGSITELAYKPRVAAEILNKELKKATTGRGLIVTKLKLYTGQNEAILDKLESTDYDTASCISLFL